MLVLALASCCFIGCEDLDRKAPAPAPENGSAVPRAPSKESAKPQIRPNPNLEEEPRCIVREGIVESINGARINFPDSEGFKWIPVADSHSVDPKLVTLGLAKVSPAIAEKHALIVRRYVTIGEYVLLCGDFDPPFPDGSLNWVVNKKEMKYVGAFLDKDSR
jgi:hypothetical protein